MGRGSDALRARWGWGTEQGLRFPMKGREDGENGCAVGQVAGWYCSDNP